MVEHGKGHRHDLRDAAAQLATGVLAAARRIDVRHVRQAAVNGAGLGGDAVVLALLRLPLFTQPPALFLTALALRFILRLADRLAYNVRLARQLLDLLLQ